MMLRFPHEYQMDSMDCGPAVLKIICKFYGQYHSVQKLRDLCGISREGISFQDLCYGAEKVGLRAFATEASIDDLCKIVRLPCIIHWKSNHFVVVYKATLKKVYVSDPAKGLVSYSLQEFVNGWYPDSQKTGAVLMLEPTPEFYNRSFRKRRKQTGNGRKSSET